MTRWRGVTEEHLLAGDRIMMLPHTAAAVSLLMTGHIGGGASGAGEETMAPTCSSFYFLSMLSAIFSF